jgi:ADP-ribose diphosphatase
MSHNDITFMTCRPAMMSKPLQKPTILHVETVARSRLFNVESVDLAFSNGEQRVYERMRPSNREAVMIVPIIDDHLLLIREYAVGIEAYELGFPKGLIDPGETIYDAANRELKEEVGFGANQLTFLKKLTMAPSYFSSKMNIVLAEGLYPESLEGDEPEPLVQERWPLAHLMDLLEDPDFSEARNVSALFLIREWLRAEGRL